jgi:hypothetical protein
MKNPFRFKSGLSRFERSRRKLVWAGFVALLFTYGTSFPAFWFFLATVMPNIWTAMGLALAMDLTLIVLTVYHIWGRRKGSLVHILIAFMLGFGNFGEMLSSSTARYTPLFYIGRIGRVYTEAIIVSALFSITIIAIIIGISQMIGTVLQQQTLKVDQDKKLNSKPFKKKNPQRIAEYGDSKKTGYA